MKINRQGRVKLIQSHSGQLIRSKRDLTPNSCQKDIREREKQGSLSGRKSIKGKKTSESWVLNQERRTKVRRRLE